MSQTTGKATTAKRTPKRRSSLRFETLNAFVDTGMTNLSRSELATWLILFRDTRPEGTASVSLADMARRGGMDIKTASRAVGRLKARRMLKTVRKGGLNRGPSIYRVFPYSME